VQPVWHEFTDFMELKTDHTKQLYSYLSLRKAVGWTGILLSLGVSCLTRGGTLYPDKPTKKHIMENEEKLIRVFTGPEPTTLLLMEMLEETGIKSLIKNDSGLGYLGAVPPVMDLYILEENLEKAIPLLNEFKEKHYPETDS